MKFTVRQLNKSKILPYAVMGVPGWEELDFVVFGNFCIAATSIGFISINLN